MKFLLLAVLATAAGAQSPPSGDLMPIMQKMVDALGVNCEYCHSAPRGSGLAEPKKEIARAMMAMMRDLNAKLPDATHKATGETVTVECVTCHRGLAVPRQLPEILGRTLREQGAAAAVEQYRDLRQRYYGRQAYDFGEGTLLDLAQRMAASKPDDAIALLKVNIEFNPRSARSYSALAYAYTRKLDDASAASALEKALEIDPENGVIQGQLEQLKSFHRRK
jgi:tetratricopeptide (TPR) repeat protein